MEFRWLRRRWCSDIPFLVISKINIFEFYLVISVIKDTIMFSDSVFISLFSMEFSEEKLVYLPTIFCYLSKKQWERVLLRGVDFSFKRFPLLKVMLSRAFDTSTSTDKFTIIKIIVIYYFFLMFIINIINSKHKYKRLHFLKFINDSFKIEWRLVIDL